jgi:hypothetical protein
MFRRDPSVTSLRPGDAACAWPLLDVGLALMVAVMVLIRDRRRAAAWQAP